MLYVPHIVGFQKNFRVEFWKLHSCNMPSVYPTIGRVEQKYKSIDALYLIFNHNSPVTEVLVYHTRNIFRSLVTLIQF